jgi:DNA ligase D-like protein (predicted polymerase)
VGDVRIEVGGEPFRISSPVKVRFPEQGWTKMDVVDHYLATGEGALRGVRNRPTMLKRWPNGVSDEPFYQKRAGKSPPMATVDIRFPSQRPGRMHVPRTLRDVMTMVQLGCLDLNPWSARADDTDHPDELRVDLDPTDGVPFDAVRRVAARVRDVLDERGLVGWPKTSGSRGIHVYARLEPRWTFYEVRRAVLALAREVGRREPLATTAWWKEERTGVFIDYNQAARDKTIASAFSVRPTGLVSAPFHWDELGDIDPHALDLARFAARWEAVGDPSRGIDEAAGDLDPLLELVVEDEERGLGDAPWPPHYPKMPGEPPRVAPSRRRMPE